MEYGEEILFLSNEKAEGDSFPRNTVSILKTKIVRVEDEG
jgi:hypothetical protein